MHAEGGEPPCFAHLLVPTEDISDHHDLERLVRDFYRHAAMDDLLGPIFAAADMDWNRHIATLVDFWAWQLFGERRYEGNPLRAHEPVHARTPFTPADFDRWVELFVDTIDELFVGPVADTAKQRGRKMAAALQRLLAGQTAAGDEPIEPLGLTGSVRTEAL